jgi:hypothetical protein
MRLGNEIDLRAARGIFRLSKLPPQMQREPSIPRRSHSMHSTHSIDRLLTISAERERIYLSDIYRGRFQHCTALHCESPKRERERERGRAGETGKREVSAEKLREEEKDSRKPSRMGCCGDESRDHPRSFILAMHREKRSAICLRSLRSAVPLRRLLRDIVEYYSHDILMALI